MSGLAWYVYHVSQAARISADEAEFSFPYAKGLQLMAVRLRGLGNDFLGPELPKEQTFSAIAGYE